MLKDLCFEVIQTCPNKCKFCSSNSSKEKKTIITLEKFQETINHFITHGGIGEDNALRHADRAHREFSSLTDKVFVIRRAERAKLFKKLQTRLHHVDDLGVDAACRLDRRLDLTRSAFFLRTGEGSLGFNVLIDQMDHVSAQDLNIADDVSQSFVSTV